MNRRQSSRATLQEEARALGDPTRHGVFRLLVDSDEPMGVSEITEHFGLNHNAIRQHLAKLMAVGLVTETRAEISGPGRPRNVYSVNPSVAGRWGAVNPYESLSHLLAEVITSGDDAPTVGRRSGAALAAEAGIAPGDPLSSLVEIMARQGFEPAIADDGDDHVEIVLHHCPFESTANDARQTVCSLHLGLAEGLVGQSDLRIDELVAREPDSAECRLHLSSRGDDTSPRLTLRTAAGDAD